MIRVTRTCTYKEYPSFPRISNLVSRIFIFVWQILPTGNTLAKLANGITDTPVLMAAKAQLRGGRPVVIGISTNDGLGLSAKNLAVLLNSKNFYFIPFGQDNPTAKRNSLVAKMELLVSTVEMAMEGRQYQPVIIEHSSAY